MAYMDRSARSSQQPANLYGLMLLPNFATRIKNETRVSEWVATTIRIANQLTFNHEPRESMPPWPHPPA